MARVPVLLLCVVAVVLLCVAAVQEVPGSTAYGTPGYVEPTCDLADDVRTREVAFWSSISFSKHPTLLPSGCIGGLSGGYWHLEVCPGRWIRQFNIQEGRVSDENYLGLQSHWSEKDSVGKETVAYADGPHTVPDRIRNAHIINANTVFSKRYECETVDSKEEVVATYPSGSFCGTSRKQRVTRLHLRCTEGEPAALKLSEPVMCEYDVILSGSYVCLLLQGNSEGPRAFRRQLVDDDMRFSL